MTASASLRHSRQALVLSTILGLHVAVSWLIAVGLAPRLLRSLVPDPPPVVVLPRAEERTVLAKPGPVEAASFRPEPVARPDVVVPVFPEVMPPAETPTEEGGVRTASASVAERFVPPGLRTHDRRLAALVDACYPAAARRRGEQGRALVHVTIGADGLARNWHVRQSTGYSRLDAAADCVIERLEFAPGTRAGRAVEAEATLPIVFRLE